MINQTITVCPGKSPALDYLKIFYLWVLWKYQNVGGKITKPPINYLDGKLPLKNNIKTCLTSYENCKNAIKRGIKANGLGFFLEPEQFSLRQLPFLVAIDLDHCLENTTLTPFAREVVNSIGGYWEVSPSGCGLRGLALSRLRLPAQRRKKDNLEIYDGGGYVTITGHHVCGTAIEMNDCTERIALLYERHFPAKTQPQPTRPTPAPTLDDATLLNKARAAGNGDKFSMLFDKGDRSFYHKKDNSSQIDSSAADFALCTMLAYWTNCDPGAMDRLFRQSALFPTCKGWDTAHGTLNYGQLTIGNAISGYRKFNKRS